MLFYLFLNSKKTVIFITILLLDFPYFAIYYEVRKSQKKKRGGIMRKVISILLAVVLILTFCSCDMIQINIPSKVTANSDIVLSDDTVTTVEISSEEQSSSKVKNPSKEKNPSKTSNTSSKKTQPTTSNNSKLSESSKTNTTQVNKTEYPTTDFYELNCRRIDDNQWQTVKVANNRLPITVQMNVPFDWTFSKVNDTTFNIMRQGKQIGVMTTGEVAKPKGILAVANKELGVIQLNQHISWYKQNGKEQFYRFYQFKFPKKDNIFTLNFNIEYTEIDDYAEYDFKENIRIIPQNVGAKLPSNTNGSKKILVIGNSFINSSQIGAFLSDMMQSTNNGYEVETISVGMATVDTFLDDIYLYDLCTSGEYSYVFMCGFYSMNTVSSFGLIKDGCDNTNTQLVIFPAHNENQQAIDAAVSSYDETGFIDWKGEIDALIRAGVDYYDFCYDDAHQHSTALAGYVGAHMIYKGLMNKVPPKTSYWAPLQYEYIEEMLGNYCKEGLPNKFDNMLEIK